MNVSDQASCKMEFKPFNRSYSQLTFMKNNILVSYLLSSSRILKINHYAQSNPTNTLSHAILNVQFFFLAFLTRVAVAIIFFTFSPLRCPLHRCNRKRYSWISAV